MTDLQKAGKERKMLAKRILDLTLEIIYLLTGEDYTVVKKTYDERLTASNHPHRSGEHNRLQSSIMNPPQLSVQFGTINDKKILNVTKRIIELLTGEVPIRCQDVSVYFSMEEWEYLEGHKDLYRDIMMEDQPPLTSPDGSSDMNTPQRCLSPLDSTQEQHTVSQNYQGDDLIMIKVETLDGKEMYVRVHEQCEEEKSPPDTGPDGHYMWNNTEEHLMTYADDVIDDQDYMADDPMENPISRDVHPVFHNGQLSPDRYTHSELFLDHLPPGTRHAAHRGSEAFLCSECGECFAQRKDFLLHQRTHTEMKLYSCLECGKCFPWRAFLIRHQRTHTGEKPYPCPECGKCFAQKSALVRHERIHNVQKAFTCSECGKHFSERSNLVLHEKVHLPPKPFSCPECNECFDQRGAFISHRKSHAGVGPYSCSVCGKYFSFKSLLIRHQRSHTGEKPFSCSECGRCFAWRSALIRHKRIHTAKKTLS